MASSDRVLARLTALHPKKIDLSLDRMERLLDRLGNPERNLPPVIHVAGTNGKGSTVAYMRAALEAAGLRVHVYTSPHLVRFAERIRIAGSLIDDDTLNRILSECEDANAAAPITFFEITTAVAFVAFARFPADAMLLEVGLGGRLDATNVVAKPAVSVISQVAMDHEQFLGTSLAAIAGEKAAIAKAGVPLMIAKQQQAAEDAILTHAAMVGAPTFMEEQDWQWSHHENGFLFRDRAGEVVLPKPALLGRHQFANAALAVAALRAQSVLPLPDKALAAGVSGVRWPARLQDISHAPAFSGKLGDNVQILLDGGHNPAGATAVAAALRQQPRPTVAILGMLANKDAAGFIAALRPAIDRLVVTAIPGEECHPPQALADIARRLDLDVAVAASPRAAMDSETARLKSGNRLLVCGSLYMAGQVLSEIGLMPD